jgi:hypothetical protein
MSMQSLAARLRDKVLAGIFDEELCQSIESSSKSSFDASTAPLQQKFTALELQLTNTKQSIALVKYLTRLGPLIGVKDYHVLLLSMVNTDNLDLTEALSHFLRFAASIRDYC